MMNRKIRRSTESDHSAMAEILQAAFGPEQGPEIEALVNHLLMDSTAQPSLSLVATVGDRLVGHILFTQVRLISGSQTISAMILAPLSVHPHYQNQGIGGQLIQDGLQRLKAEGIGLVFVLGYPAYYTKYGFTTASVQDFAPPYPLAPEQWDAWMLKELHPGILGHFQGSVQCADALNQPQYWHE